MVRRLWEGGVYEARRLNMVRNLQTELALKPIKVTNISGADQDESSEWESSHSDEEDKDVSYFGVSVLTNNYVTFNNSDETKRLVFILSLCEQTFVEELIIFENMYWPFFSQNSLLTPWKHLKTETLARKGLSFRSNSNIFWISRNLSTQFY